MRAAALVAACLVSVPAAASEPLVVGSIRSRGNGEIIFLSTTEHCKSGKRGYVRADGGQISFLFCWTLSGQTFWASYDDGDQYSYPLSAIEITAEYAAWLTAQGQQQGAL